MKADIVHFFTGQTVLAIPGVTSLHYLEKALKELTQLGVRHVMTCFDMDYLKNWHVEAAYGNLIQLLVYAGKREKLPALFHLFVQTDMDTLDTAKPIPAGDHNYRPAGVSYNTAGRLSHVGKGIDFRGA